MLALNLRFSSGHNEQTRHTSARRVGRDEEVDLEAAGVSQQLALGPVRPAVAAAHRRARHHPRVGSTLGRGRHLGALRVVAGADAAVVAAGRAVVARIVAAPLQLDAAGKVHCKVEGWG